MNKEKNLLDLRPKVEPEIKIVERIVLKKRGFPVELFKMLVVIAVCSLIVWGVSKATNNGSNSNSSIVTAKNFSVMGIVTGVGSSSISINSATGGELNVSSYTFDTTYADKIVTNDMIPILLSNIQQGYRVLAQGVEVSDGTIVIHRIVSFGTSTDMTVTMVPVVATSTEQKPANITNATSTHQQDADTTNATSTESSDVPVVTPVASTSSEDSIASSTPSLPPSDQATSSNTDESSSSATQTVSPAPAQTSPDATQATQPDSSGSSTPLN